MPPIDKINIFFEKIIILDGIKMYNQKNTTSSFHLYYCLFLKKNEKEVNLLKYQTLAFKKFHKVLKKPVQYNFEFKGKLIIEGFHVIYIIKDIWKEDYFVDILIILPNIVFMLSNNILFIYPNLSKVSDWKKNSEKELVLHLAKYKLFFLINNI